jgi:hypothetical protein
MEHIDLRDSRGRLTRLGIAAAISLVVTFFVMHAINSWSRPANSDPIGSSTVPLLAIGMFVVVTAFVAGLLARIARRREPGDVRWLVAIAACSAPAPPPALGNATPQQPVTVLRMERTECLSGCPEYTIEITNTGSVKWHGIANVEILGDTVARISQADVQRILVAFDRAGFFQRAGGGREKFREDCTLGRCVTVICDSLDAPATRVTIVRDGEPHTYEAQRCESAIDRAEDLVDEIVGAKVWIGLRAD